MIPPPPPPTLTARQAEIAALVAEGLSNAEIGARLIISKRTVERHLAEIAARLRGTAPPRERILLHLLHELGETRKRAA